MQYYRGSATRKKFKKESSTQVEVKLKQKVRNLSVSRTPLMRHVGKGLQLSLCYKTLLKFLGQESFSLSSRPGLKMKG